MKKSKRILYTYNTINDFSPGSICTPAIRIETYTYEKALLIKKIPGYTVESIDNSHYQLDLEP